MLLFLKCGFYKKRERKNMKKKKEKKEEKYTLGPRYWNVAVLVKYWIIFCVPVLAKNVIRTLECTAGIQKQTILELKNGPVLPNTRELGPGVYFFKKQNKTKQKTKKQKHQKRTHHNKETLISLQVNKIFILGSSFGTLPTLHFFQLPHKATCTFAQYWWIKLWWKQMWWILLIVFFLNFNWIWRLCFVHDRISDCRKVDDKSH